MPLGNGVLYIRYSTKNMHQLAQREGHKMEARFAWNVVFSAFQLYDIHRKVPSGLVLAGCQFEPGQGQDYIHA